MEEKDRYKFDKERYIIFQDDIFDLSNVCDLLNKQAQRIKELEKQQENYTNFISYQFEENKLRYNKLNKELTEQIQELQEKLHILNEQSQNNYYRESYTEALKENNQLDKRIEELEEENRQLKQQLYDLPKKIIDDIKCYSFINNIEYSNEPILYKI